MKRTASFCGLSPCGQPEEKKDELFICDPPPPSVVAEAHFLSVRHKGRMQSGKRGATNATMSACKEIRLECYG